jgi:hypothetical protein
VEILKTNVKRCKSAREETEEIKKQNRKHELELINFINQVLHQLKQGLTCTSLFYFAISQKNASLMHCGTSKQKSFFPLG